ncbi:MAG: phosphoribosyltransferase family protein [Candidatus Paceibacterota bacterium]|jgi:ComF family protein
MRIIHNPIIKEFFVLKDWLLDFFFPLYCLDCKTEGYFLCPVCRQKLPPPGGDQLPDWIMAGFDYRDEKVRELIWRLKYQKQTAVASEMAEMMWSASEINAVNSNGPIWLVPVPLFWWRRFQRGYNQAEILAREIAKLQPGKFVVKNKLIKKIKNTTSQAKIKKRSERLENLKGAFALVKNIGEIPHHQTIILIDDVTTTGATLTELRRLLTRAGARHIHALVFAHG